MIVTFPINAERYELINNAFSAKIKIAVVTVDKSSFILTRNETPGKNFQVIIFDDACLLIFGCQLSPVPSHVFLSARLDGVYETFATAIS
jgi:hypothetical protein